MQDYYFVTIDGRPIAKSNMYGVRVVGKRGIMYTTKELEEYELLVGKAVSDAIPTILPHDFYSIYLRIYQHGKKWIDVDNCFKAIQDGMDSTKTIKRGKQEIKVCESGIENDRYFQLIVGERIIVESAEEQRVELIIAPYRGLFNLVSIVKEHYKIDEDYHEQLILPL